MKNIMEMTWKEIDEVNKAKGILCITVAPIEEHGLHLPLGTDIYEGEHWIKLLAEKMESKYEIECYKSIPFYTASASANYPCSVHFSPKTTKLAVYELIKNFAEYLVDAVRAFIERKDFEQYEHHFLHDRLIGMTV